MADKKFSIVIPVHNSEKTLAACLDSCIGQSYRNIEIFCVDDYSTDTSPDILKQYAEKDNRLRFISLSENVNSYMARKIGLQYVTGDYILFLDSDDTLVPDACETIDGRLHGEEIDIVEFGYTCIPGGNMMLPPRSITLKDRLQDLLSSDPHLPSAIWTLAYKRQLLLLAFSKTRDFNAFMAEDVYISIIVLYYAKTFMTLNKPLVNYSTSGMSNTKT
ncbi:MAG: glycosyltransferase, partial [Spirochaetaceae bacterium]|nr:glycosyltransferase [Spirochaetaceae bacterium]